MKSEERKAIKNISRHKDLETDLPVYGNGYINAVYEYSLIRLVLNYYTLKEVYDEGGSIASDDVLSGIIDELNTIIYDEISLDDKDKSTDIMAQQDNISVLHSIRNKLTKEMRVLTAYTDALQIYEYVLNRVEFGITGEKYKVDPEKLSEKLFRYLFSDNDKMVINSKIQMVTAQLPVRMTKSRFFDYLTDTLNIYNGSDKKSFDDFCEMIISTALLEKPEGFGTLYPEIYNLIKQLDNTDYKTLDEVEYKALMELFGITTSHLTDVVSNHLLTMEVVNALYTIMLVKPYERNEEESIEVCIDMIKLIHDAYVTCGSIPEEVDEGFYKIEGIQENLTEDIMQFESVLPDILEGAADEISWIMADKIFGSLNTASKLMSDSLFIEINREQINTINPDNDDKDNSDETTDSDYIIRKRDEMVILFDTFFANHPKMVNRAVMGAVFSNMPVLFNSMQETKDYIEHSLSKCGNDSELMACGKILDEMMAQE